MFYTCTWNVNFFPRADGYVLAGSGENHRNDGTRWTSSWCQLHYGTYQVSNLHLVQWGDHIISFNRKVSCFFPLQAALCLYIELDFHWQVIYCPEWFGECGDCSGSIHGRWHKTIIVPLHSEWFTWFPTFRFWKCRSFQDLGVLGGEQHFYDMIVVVHWRHSNARAILLELSSLILCLGKKQIVFM